MQCPACGYETVPEEAVFCPHCRHRFQEPELDVSFRTPRFKPKPVPYHCRDDDRLSGREIRKIQIQLLQPAVLVMIALAAGLYLAVGRIQDLTFSSSFFEIRYGGLLCLVTGALLAWIFYRIALWWIQS